MKSNFQSQAFCVLSPHRCILVPSHPKFELSYLLRQWTMWNHYWKIHNNWPIHSMTIAIIIHWLFLYVLSIQQYVDVFWCPKWKQCNLLIHLPVVNCLWIRHNKKPVHKINEIITIWLTVHLCPFSVLIGWSSFMSLHKKLEMRCCVNTCQHRSRSLKQKTGQDRVFIVRNCGIFRHG